MNQTVESVTRYVITHLDKQGHRIMSAPARQGRYTHETAAEAQAVLKSMTDNSDPATLRQVHGSQARGTYAVRPCECWPGHFDPQTYYFD